MRRELLKSVLGRDRRRDRDRSITGLTEVVGIYE
jgi:hypothetical protein